MDRSQAFEEMLAEVRCEYESRKSGMEELKAQGKERTATFKQYMADKLLYQRMLALYEKHGLL